MRTMLYQMKLENVMNFFIDGHVSDYWYNIIDSILEKLKINGSWIWPNANLVFTKTGVDEYNVKSI